MWMTDLVRDEDKRGLLLLALSGFSLLASFFVGGRLPVDPAWIAIILCGVPILRGAVTGLVTAFDVKADVLVALALIASVIIGEIFAAGEVAFIMAVGAMLEERTVAKARAGIEKLVRLTPRTARRVREGEETIIPAAEVCVGDVLRVLAGESIAVDGIVVSGRTSVDQAIMTGESLPVDKTVGDAVASGTVNQFGTFDMRATKIGEDSLLQRMIRLVESADAGKAKIVRLADRWATWIVAIALIAAAATWLVTGEVIRAVTILVVFCPCALVLATPTAIMAGIGNAARNGILIREGDALERLAEVTHVAFDKTGTLTLGKPSVTDVYSPLPDLTPGRLLTLTAVAELRSEHPLGKALVAHARQHESLSEPDDFLLLPGRGVQALVDGVQVLAGNAALFAERALPLPADLLDRSAKHAHIGGTVIFVALDGHAAGFIAFADTLRPEAAQAVARIASGGVRSALLTGDNSQSAAHIGAQAGIADITADCLPETKLAHIAAYEQRGSKVCMVGDGINDAPALKRSYVGIAMGGIGSDIAVDAADVVLTSDDIKAVPHLLALAQRTMRTIKVNMALSMALNFTAIGLAMYGWLTPVSGALVHNVGSVAVILSSAMLLRKRFD